MIRTTWHLWCLPVDLKRHWGLGSLHSTGHLLGCPQDTQQRWQRGEGQGGSGRVCREALGVALLLTHDTYTHSWAPRTRHSLTQPHTLHGTHTPAHHVAPYTHTRVTLTSLLVLCFFYFSL